MRKAHQKGFRFGYGNDKLISSQRKRQEKARAPYETVFGEDQDESLFGQQAISLEGSQSRIIPEFLEQTEANLVVPRQTRKAKIEISNDQTMKDDKNDSLSDIDFQ